jgi:hypothetical protein
VKRIKAGSSASKETAFEKISAQEATISMKKFLLAGITALCLVLPGTTALATSDDLSGDIHQGQANSAANSVKEQVATAEDEQAGEVGQDGQIDQVGEFDQVGDKGDANDASLDTSGGSEGNS